MLKYATLIYLISMPALAYGTFTCKELDRISLAAEGSMAPAYPGRKFTFSWDINGFSGDGVFYHKDYEVTKISEMEFSAIAKNSDRHDLFRFEKSILMHTAIVNYRSEPSIQSQVFSCMEVN
ncbi:hypothetical protein N9D83_06990 [Amylibacter sp.]|nr:hypothetical protein [Amylibacter sp.]